MLFSSDDITTDADEAEFGESLRGYDISFALPDPSAIAEQAAKWVDSPNVMLEILTNDLNQILSKCEARLFDEVLIQMKPEYVGESSPARMHVVFMAISLGETAKTVDLVNAIQTTPFAGETIWHLGKMLYRGNSPEFDGAVSRYKSSLKDLANWIHAKRILSGNAVSSPEKRKSADIDDFKRAFSELKQKGVRPTKENIGDLLRSWNMTIGTTRAHSLKREIERQSAVRPPESAD
jgi:hypothetical protein